MKLLIHMYLSLVKKFTVQKSLHNIYLKDLMNF